MNAKALYLVRREKGVEITFLLSALGSAKREQPAVRQNDLTWCFGAFRATVKTRHFPFDRESAVSIPRGHFPLDYIRARLVILRGEHHPWRRSDRGESASSRRSFVTRKRFHGPLKIGQAYSVLGYLPSSSSWRRVRRVYVRRTGRTGRYRNLGRGHWPTERRPRKLRRGKRVC